MRKPVLASEALLPRTCTVILAALLSPCVLIAQAVQEDERYLVYHDFILDTPLELRLQFGPTGAYGWVKENHLVVRGVAPKSPADGVLRMHDIITGVNSVPFAEGCDPRRAMADGITQSETERVKGRLELSIIRDGEARTVNLRLKVMGTYSETWPFDCAKSRRVLDEACAYVAQWQHPNGYCEWFWNPLVFVAHPDLRYRDHARRAAHYMAGDLVEYNTAYGHPYVRGLTSWRYSYKAIFLCEYYLATVDATVLPALQKLIDWIGRGQMKCGSWGHRAPWGGYGALNQAGLTCFMALLLARETGVTVDEEEVKRSVKFFGNFVSIGGVPYGDHPPYGYRENQGKCATASIAFRFLGKPEWSRIMGSMVCLSYDTFEFTHAGGMFTWLWSPLGGIHAPEEEFRVLCEEIRWFYELGRTGRGAIVGQPTPENLSGRTWSGAGGTPRHSTGAMALVYALPYKRLRIFGCEKEPVPDPRNDPAAKEDIRLTLASIRSNLAKGNIYLASEQIKALRRYRKDVAELAKLESKIPVEGLAAEKEAADACFPNFKVRKWLHDLDVMNSMKQAAAMPDGYYSRFARKQLPLLIPPRRLHQNKWQTLAKGTDAYQVVAWKADVPVTAESARNAKWKAIPEMTTTSLSNDAEQALFRRTFEATEPVGGVVALRLIAPSESRVYLNGHAIVQTVRAKLRKAQRPWTILLHPKTREILKKGRNELIVRIPELKAAKGLTMAVDLVSADAPKGDAQ